MVPDKTIQNYNTHYVGDETSFDGPLRKVCDCSAESVCVKFNII